MRVTHFHRKANGVFFSIEQLFEDIRAHAPEEVQFEVAECRFPSKGVWRRVYDSLRAISKQGDVNHITGDVHFLTYFLKRRKTILTIHDCVSLERLSGLKYWVFWFFWYWLPSRRCAAVTVISTSTKSELERHLSMKHCPVKVIGDCISADFQRQEKDFDEACPRILQVGTTPNKNIERVAMALSKMKCKLVVIGRLSPDQRAALGEHGIDFEDHVGIPRAEMIRQYELCDLVMFASLYEGFGLPILEANAVGRPVVSSNLYSMPEVGGNACCYVDPYDVDSIRLAVEKIVSDREYRSTLVEYGVLNAQRYSPSAIASDYVDLYREICNGNAR
jgi:glycosyltransferase involved in cell wall biosynthesis